MARLEAQKDLCHTPSPVDLCEMIGATLDVPPKAHALDPCCGTGEALAAVLGGRGTSYGVELDVARAKSAQGRLDRVICSDTQEARLARHAFGLVFLNPPFDNSVHGRLEVTFLERSIDWLAPGGILVYIIKASQYTGEICRILSKNFDNLRHARFPDPYFDGPELAFRQTVLIGRKKAVPLPDPTGMMLLQSTLPLLEPFGTDGAPYVVPATATPATFLPGQLNEPQMIDLLKASPIARVPKLVGDLGGKPPLPLGTGHRALVLASGLLDGVYGRGERLHVSKGTIRPVTTTKKHVEYDDEGRPQVIFTQTDGFEILVRVLTPQGVIETVTGAKPEAEDGQVVTTSEQEDAA